MTIPVQAEQPFHISFDFARDAAPSVWLITSDNMMIPGVFVGVPASGRPLRSKGNRKYVSGHYLPNNLAGGKELTIFFGESKWWRGQDMVKRLHVQGAKILEKTRYYCAVRRINAGAPRKGDILKLAHLQRHAYRNRILHAAAIA